MKIVETRGTNVEIVAMANRLEDLPIPRFLLSLIRKLLRHFY